MLQQEITKNSELEYNLYQNLGKKFFLYISPSSTDADFSDQVIQLNKVLLKKFTDKKNGTTLKASVQQYIQGVKKVFEEAQKELKLVMHPPVILEDEKEKLDTLIYNFLYAQHIMQQIRAQEAMPEIAIYALEFFIPPLTDQEKTMLRLVDKREEQLNQTLSIDMPFALLLDKDGNFDMQETIKHEQQYHLIKTKLANITKGEITSSILFHKLINFPAWAFFTINHKTEIEQISDQLTQIVFDTMMIFAYKQIEKGIPPSEAIANGYAFLGDFSKRKDLDQLIVFRAEEEMPLDLYILQMLGELKTEKTYIKEETLKEFYTHILKCLNELISEQKIIPGLLFDIEIRKSTEQERDRTGSPYTIAISQILNSGRVNRSVQEFYQVKLSDQSEDRLMFVGLQGLEPEHIYL